MAPYTWCEIEWALSHNSWYPLRISEMSYDIMVGWDVWMKTIKAHNVQDIWSGKTTQDMSQQRKTESTKLTKDNNKSCIARIWVQQASAVGILLGLQWMQLAPSTMHLCLSILYLASMVFSNLHAIVQEYNTLWSCPQHLKLYQLHMLSGEIFRLWQVSYADSSVCSCPSDQRGTTYQIEWFWCLVSWGVSRLLLGMMLLTIHFYELK